MTLVSIIKSNQKKITHSNLTNIRVITYTITFVRKDVVSQYLVYLVVNIEKINFKLQLKAFEIYCMLYRILVKTVEFINH